MKNETVTSNMMIRRSFDRKLVVRSAIAFVLLGGLVIAYQKPSPAPQPPALPSWNPTNWKNGDKSTSTDNRVSVTVAKIGPNLWSYAVEGQPCRNCTPGMAVDAELQSVQIVSNYVSDKCGNINPKDKHVISTTKGWDPNATGEIIEGPKNGTKEMTFNIDCDAKNGPVYLIVENTVQKQSKSTTVGPIPGPTAP